MYVHAFFFLSYFIEINLCRSTGRTSNCDSYSLRPETRNNNNNDMIRLLLDLIFDVIMHDLLSCMFCGGGVQLFSFFSYASLIQSVCILLL